MWQPWLFTTPPSSGRCFNATALAALETIISTSTSTCRTWWRPTLAMVAEKGGANSRDSRATESCERHEVSMTATWDYNKHQGAQKIQGAKTPANHRPGLRPTSCNMVKPGLGRMKIRFRAPIKWHFISPSLVNHPAALLCVRPQTRRETESLAWDPCL